MCGSGVRSLHPGCLMRQQAPLLNVFGPSRPSGTKLWRRWWRQMTHPCRTPTGAATGARWEALAWRSRSRTPLALSAAPAVCVPAAPRARACKLPGDWAQCAHVACALMGPRMCGWKILPGQGGWALRLPPSCH